MKKGLIEHQRSQNSNNNHYFHFRLISQSPTSKKLIPLPFKFKNQRQSCIQSSAKTQTDLPKLTQLDKPKIQTENDQLTEQTKRDLITLVGIEKRSNMLPSIMKKINLHNKESRNVKMNSNNINNNSFKLQIQKHLILSHNKIDSLVQSPERETNNSFALSKSNSPSKISLFLKRNKFNKGNNNNFIISSKSLMGSKSVNQDNVVTIENIFNLNNFCINAVFDGHGQNGHFISNLAKTTFMSYFTNDSNLYYIPRKRNQIPKANEGAAIQKLSSLKEYINENDLYSRIALNNYKIIKDIYPKIETVIEQSDYDKEFSGTTCCSIFLLNSHCICSNIGDSRAILISCDGKAITALSTDHKPNIQTERKRILSHGGEVRMSLPSVTINNSNYPYRVYAKDLNYPGLAMSRSLGDFVAKNYGVTCEDDIIDVNLSKDDMAIVIGSDGVWDQMSNEDIRDIIVKYYKGKKSEDAVNEIVFESRKRFESKGDYIDDISAIVLMINIKE